MKRVITGVVILISLISFGCWSLWETCERCKNISELTEQALESIEQQDQDKTEDYTNQLISRWEEDEKVLELIIRHSTLEEIERQISMLSQWAELKNADEISICLCSIQSLCKHISQSEPPTLLNLL